jgi:hypothetical protein
MPNATLHILFRFLFFRKGIRSVVLENLAGRSPTQLDPDVSDKKCLAIYFDIIQ